MLGDPGWDGIGGEDSGRVSIIELRGNGPELVENIVGGVPGLRIGRDVFAVDFHVGAQPMLAFSGVGGELVVGDVTIWEQRVRFSSEEPDEFGSFGRALTGGLVGRGRSPRWVVGQPNHGASMDGSGAGRVVFLDLDGEVTAAWTGSDHGDQFGRELAVVPRPAPYPSLVVVARRNGNSVAVIDRRYDEPEVLADEEGVEFGTSISVSNRLADGTFRLFVGDPGYDGGRGRVATWSIR